MLFGRKHKSIVLSPVLLVGWMFAMASTSLAQSDTWTDKAPMPTARIALSTSAVNGMIYAIGGATDLLPPHPGIDRVQEYTAAMVTTGVEDSAGEPIYPGSMALYQKYPNPFTTSTDIRFELPEAQPVRLVVYDVLGRAVRVLVNGIRRAGMHKVVLEAGDLPSGLYLCRLETPRGSFTGTMQLVK
jgi:hypothetical protein